MKRPPEILEECFAKGEIDKDEFQAKTRPALWLAPRAAIRVATPLTVL